jgi:GT2 family glycosyltransferase/glycosyltransferase involved in cell wall biosynthesis
MRVLHIVHGFPPAASGGTEGYVRHLAHAFAACPADSVFVLTRDADPCRREYAVTRHVDGRVSVIRINNMFQSCASFEESYTNPALLRIAMREIAAIDPDVVHVHHLTCLSTGLLEAIATLGIPLLMTLNDYWLICHRGQLFDLKRRRCNGPFGRGCSECLPAGALATPLAYRAGHAARRSGVPGLAIVAHTMIKATEAATPRTRTATATVARLHHMQSVARHVDLFLAPSATLENLFLQFGIPRVKLKRCEQGIDTAAFEGRRRTPSDVLRLGYAGGIIPSKAPHLLLQAAQLLPHGSISIDLLGPGGPFHGDVTYAREILPLLSASYVRRIGPVPPERMADALANVDVVVVPSVWIENAPFIIREAFAARLPVIAANLGGMAEMVRHEVDGLLFEPGDSKALAAAIGRCLREPELLDRLRQGIRPPMSIQDDAAQLRELYSVLRRRVAIESPSLPKNSPWGLDDNVTGPGGSAASIAAVVLNYRTADQTWLAARSLQTSRAKPERILIVDNGSQDGSAESLRETLSGVEVVETGANLGFSGGCNVALRRILESSAHFALLVNSDAVLHPDAIGALVHAAQVHQDAGVLAPVLLSREEPDHIASAGLSYSQTTGRIKHRAVGRPLRLLTPLTTHQVDAVSGCVMLIRLAALRRAGLLREEFFFYFEDLEFCLRIREAGFKVLCVPDAVAYHEGGRSIGRRSSSRVYYAARNHLYLADRTSEGNVIKRAARVSFIVGLNVAHALTSADVPLFRGLAAVSRGTWHHFRRRYGPA